MKNISGMRILKNINLFLQKSALLWESEEAFIEWMTLSSQEAKKQTVETKKKVECAETFKVDSLSSLRDFFGSTGDCRDYREKSRPRAILATVRFNLEPIYSLLFSF